MRAAADGVRALLAAAGDDDGRLGLLIGGAFAALFGPAGRRLKPVSFADGELFMVAADEHWLAEGRRRSGTIRRRINEAFGRELVTGLSLRLDPHSFAAEETRAAREKKVETAPTPEVGEAAERIGDPRARAAFLSLAASVSALRGSKGS